MRALVVTLTLLISLTTSAAEPVHVAARMRHVLLHMGYGVELQVDDLRGYLESKKPGPPVFDDIQSYLVSLDYARVAMTAQSMTNLMNQYVFAPTTRESRRSRSHSRAPSSRNRACSRKRFRCRSRCAPPWR